MAEAKKSKEHHGEAIQRFTKELIKIGESTYIKNIEEFLEEVQYMEPFYEWPKEKQKRVEAEYYLYEKRMLAYMRNGGNKQIKDRLILHIVRMYQTLIYKYIGWYQKSQYQCINYSSEEVKTTLEALLVSTIHYYISKCEEVRIPFGSFVKNRVFIQFRGELQDVYRKILLYEQWKDKLYEKSLPKKTRIEEEGEYEMMYERMELFKTFMLEPSPVQRDTYGDEFMHNFFLIYHTFHKKSISGFNQKIKYDPKSHVASVKTELKRFKEQVGYA